MDSIVALGQESPIALLLAALLARWTEEARSCRLALTSTTAGILVDHLPTDDLDLAGSTSTAGRTG